MADPSNANFGKQCKLVLRYRDTPGKNHAIISFNLPPCLLYFRLHLFPAEQARAVLVIQQSQRLQMCGVS
jgi:hypothetical protein